MKVLVIYAHPSPQSFNHALLEAFLAGLIKAGHEYEVIDLYKEKFNPILTDTSPRAPLAEDVKRYQERIVGSDCLAFVFPTFWYRAPAIMEGFIDRVFTSHFAYRYQPFVKHMKLQFIPLIGKLKIPKGLLPCKKAVVIQTYGGPSWYYRFLFLRLPWLRFRAVLRFFGVRKIIYQSCYYVPFGSAKTRARYLKKTEKIGARLK